MPHASGMEPEPEPCCFDGWAAGNAKRARRKGISAGITKDLLDALGSSVGDRSVLDLGCGTGDLALGALARGRHASDGLRPGPRGDRGGASAGP